MDGMNGIRLGSNLKAILRSRGISLKKISAKTGIPYSTLHTWLQNRQPKDILKVKILADFLGADLEQLLFGDQVQATLDLPSKEQDFLGIFEVIVRRKQ